MSKLEDYKQGIVEFIDKWREEEDEDKAEDYLSEAISLAHRLADFDHIYYGVQLSYLYEIFKKGEI